MNFIALALLAAVTSHLPLYAACTTKEGCCLACQGGLPVLKGDTLTELHSQLKEGWRIVEEHHLEKIYLFPDFKSALAFTNKVGEIAEEEGHHPDIQLSWGKVKITIWTHSVDGLTETDFILAAKCDAALK